jgi:hypothetical protein
VPVLGDGFLGLCPLGQSSSIDRCVLISGLALLPALSGMPFTAIAQTQTTQDSALGSWNDGPAKQAIIDFVRATTDQASPKFVLPEERIATFDQDGKPRRKAGT